MDGVCFRSDEEERVCREVLKNGDGVAKKGIYVTLKSGKLGGGKRPNWMRATAFLGEFLYLLLPDERLEYV